MRGRARGSAALSSWPRTLLLAALLLQLSAASAYASGNAIARFGGEHGTVNATNPTALYYNPAGLGFSEGSQLFVDGQLALRSLQWTHAMGQGDAPEPAGFAGANYGTATALNLFGGPMLGASVKLGQLTLGAAAYAPFGGNVHFDRTETFAGSMYPGAADGVARWHGYDAGTMSIYATAGGAYRIGPVSIGLTGNLIYSTISMARAQNLNGSNELTGEGRSKLDVSGVNGSFGAGVMVEALPQMLWLSLSYQAQPGLGTMQLSGKLEVDATVPKSTESVTQDVTLHQALPDIFRLGARLRPSSDVELRLAADWTRWNVLRTQCVAVKGQTCAVTPSGDAADGSGTVLNLRRYFQNVVGVRAGVSVWVTPALELFGGLGFETAAVPDATLDPVLADAANIAIAVGGRVAIAERWHLAASYTHLQFLARDSTGKSKLADPDVGLTTRRPDGGGRYTQWVGILNANLMYSF